MARDQKVKVRIQAKDEASAEIKKTEKGFARLTSAVRANAAAIASAVAVVYGMVRVLGTLARAAFDSENAVRKMEAAMKTAGDYSKAASEDMQAFAKGLQSIGTESDESILAMISLAKGFVGTNEEAKKLVQTALDFKEIAGIAFEESVRRIGRATGGSTEDIAKFDRRILDLTKSQLANGEATRLLGEKYAGLNKAMSETAEGGIKKLENTFQDLQAAFGRGAIDAVELSDSINDLNESLQNQTTFAERAGTLLAVYFSEMVKGRGHALSMATALKELHEIISKTADVTGEAATAANKKAAADKAAAAAAAAAKADQEALTKALSDQAEAYATAIESASAFGEVTSVQLEAQIIAIIQALHDQKVILGESSVEYQRLAEVAGGKIDSLKTRIEHLRDGLGDLKDKTGEAADAMSDYARGMDAATRSTESNTRAVNTHVGALNSQAAAARRVQLPGGGSRLTSSPSDPLFRGGGPSGGTFTTITPGAYIGADGRVYYS